MSTKFSLEKPLTRRKVALSSPAPQVASLSEPLTASSLQPVRPWYDRPLIMLAVLAVPLIVQITPLWQPADDAIGYLSLGHAIANGGPLRMLGSKALHYAIGYPLLIAPAFYLQALPLVPVLVLNFVFALLTAWGIYLWARSTVNSSAFFIAGLTVWNVSYWDLYRQPLSEVVFTAALVLGALACRSLLAAKGTRQILLMTIAASLMVIAVSTIRQVGIFLAAGYGMAALIQAFRKESTWTRSVLTTLAVGVPASVLLVGLLLAYRSYAEGDSGAHTYVDLIIDPQMTFFGQLAEAVRLRMAEIGRQLLPGFFKSYGHMGEWLNINTILYAIVSAAVGYGWWKLVRKSADVLLLTAPFYLAVYIFWPFDQGTRFMAPMLPVLWLCVWKLATNWRVSPNQVLAWLLVLHLGQSFVYLGAYLIAARQNTADLNALTELAPIYREDSSVVCGVGIMRETEMFVNLLLDDRIPIVKKDEAPPAEAKWAVTEKGDAVVPGFTKERQVGRITLFVRTD